MSSSPAAKHRGALAVRRLEETSAGRLGEVSQVEFRQVELREVDYPGPRGLSCPRDEWQHEELLGPSAGDIPQPLSLPRLGLALLLDHGRQPGRDDVAQQPMQAIVRRTMDESFAPPEFRRRVDRDDHGHSSPLAPCTLTIAIASRSESAMPSLRDATPRQSAVMSAANRTQAPDAVVAGAFEKGVDVRRGRRRPMPFPRPQHGPDVEALDGLREQLRGRGGPYLPAQAPQGDEHRVRHGSWTCSGAVQRSNRVGGPDAGGSAMAMSRIASSVSPTSGPRIRAPNAESVAGIRRVLAPE